MGTLPGGPRISDRRRVSKCVVDDYRSISLKMFERRDRSGILRVPGVEGGSRLEEHDVDLLFGDWPMLHSARHDQEFTLFEPDHAIAEVHPKASLDHEEEFVFVLMVVPDELPLELHEPDLLTVQLTNDPRIPVVVKQGELLLEIHLLSVVSGGRTHRNTTRVAIAG